jgi:hypothetical protein
MKVHLHLHLHGGVHCVPAWLPCRVSLGTSWTSSTWSPSDTGTLPTPTCVPTRLMPPTLCGVHPWGVARHLYARCTTPVHTLARVVRAALPCPSVCRLCLVPPPPPRPPPPRGGGGGARDPPPGGGGGGGGGGAFLAPSFVLASLCAPVASASAWAAVHDDQLARWFTTGPGQLAP